MEKTAFNATVEPQYQNDYQYAPSIADTLPPPAYTEATQAPLSSSSSQPQPQLLGLDPRFCHNKQATLLLDQSWSFSGGDFTVTTTQGQPVVSVVGRSFSMTSRVEFMMPSSRENLFTVRRELVNFGAPNYYIEQPGTGASLAEITGRIKLIGGAGNFDITFPNIAGFRAGPLAAAQANKTQVSGRPDQVRLQCSGDIMDSNIQIVALTPRGKVVVAEVKRHRFQLRAKFEVIVWPGVDAALIVAILICITNRRNR